MVYFIALLKSALFVSITMILPSELHSHRGYKYSLKKANSYNGCLIKEAPLLLNKGVSVNENTIEDLKPLLEKLKLYTEKDNLKILYNNLASLKITKNYGIGWYARGLYNTKENRIILASKKTLPHEFIHCASSEYDIDNDTSYSGFRQYHDELKMNIGHGLNEGYTELLTSRIYRNNKPDCYFAQVRIAKLIECFLDNPKDMEKYYFSHDLKGLFKYMKKFASENDIIELLLMLDNITFYNLSINYINIISKTIKMELSLYKWFMNNINDIERRKKFMDILLEDKILSIIIKNEKLMNRILKGEKFKLYKNSFNLKSNSDKNKKM